MISVDTRTPMITTGHAIGSSMRRRRCQRDNPIPSADSVMAGSTPRRPVMVFRTMGNRAYMTRATTVGR